ncbi:MAG: hypothetical protein KF901_10135 [Myxococcales bacterium]|nr:hypothetical protein [Myxococcales bacterium]
MSLEQQLHLHPSREGALLGALGGGVMDETAEVRGDSSSLEQHLGRRRSRGLVSLANEGGSEGTYRRPRAHANPIVAPRWACAHTLGAKGEATCLPAFARDCGSDFGGVRRQGLLFGEVPTS